MSTKPTTSSPAGSTFWGANYARLAGIKRAYDPANLFRVRHGVGSEVVA